ncbi:TlpA family protein disulfide reductase [Nocardioides sp. GY 10113]|uniref:TlpA disulfide reductase family protein n=1 Tax=Nocardioides sp. GY 10113 TaxID=2569761 RepID=UPI0010A91ABA|nr:TlpA disulfide reductase family protein [Nocardioides sp. GY 10113]TIC89258.1 TlpA family protein disulfide reductase [Nocardioides sp. GY 10113]
MNRVLRAAGAGLALALLATGCSSVEGTEGKEYIAGDSQVVEVAEVDREEPVEVAGTTVAGDDLDLVDLRGQVVVVNVWWSGCGPCRTEMPMLVEAEQSLSADHPGQVSFVGINIRDAAPENAAAFERDRGVDYPSLYDPGSKTLLGFGRYAPYAPPATLVLDTDGRVAALINGPIPSRSTLTTLVEELLPASAEAADG